MKSDELNLDVLENADEETVDSISEKYDAVSEEDISRLYRRSETMYKDKKNETSLRTSVDVAVVSQKRSSVLKKIAAFAAVLTLATGTVTGGVILLRRSVPISDVVTDDTEYVSSAPFGDVSNGRIRFTSPAYVPYLYEISSDKVRQLAEVFNSGEWEETDVTGQLPDGESNLVFVENNDRKFRLKFYPDCTVDCETDGSTVRYRVSEKVQNAVYSFADSDDIYGNLIWSKIEDLTAEGAWKNNEPVPENIFEAASAPDELKDKTIVDNEPLYDYAYDFQDTVRNAAEASDLIIGKVNGITYTSRWGVAYTLINITVSEDTEGKLSAGDNVDVEFVGGYVSLKEQRKSIEGIHSENGDENSEEESDVSEDEDTWCHEIVFSGDVPIVGKEYAFFVVPNGGTSEKFEIVGQEYGVLYKCDNIYIQRRNSGYEFYDIDELKKLMEAEPSFSPPKQFTITE